MSRQPIPYDIESEFKGRFPGVPFQEVTEFFRRSVLPEQLYDWSELKAATAESEAELPELPTE